MPSLAPARPALLLRRANTGTTVRVLQMGDPVPGISGGQIDLLFAPRLNSSAKLAFTADYGTSTNVQRVILVFDGVGFQNIVNSSDIAPGTGGAIFGRTITLGGINDAGDIAFTADLRPLGSPASTPAQTTLFIVPSGGAPVRIAGQELAAGNGPLVNISLASGTTSLNNAGEVVFGFPNALFVGSTAGVRTVFATGTSLPGRGIVIIPGTNADGPPPPARLNNAGQVAFAIVGGLWVHTPSTGITRAIDTGNAAPAALGGTFGTNSVDPSFVLSSFNDAGAVAFSANISGSGVTPRGLFRFVPGTGVQTVAYANQAASGASPAIFSTFSSVSMNSTGIASFRATLANGSIARGGFSRAAQIFPLI